VKKTDLIYFKKSLTAKREQIMRNISDLSDNIRELRSSGASDELDMASINTDSNLDHSISAKQKVELEKINSALGKIESGKYGLCEMCEEEIAIERLKAYPSARYCISCKEQMEKSQR